MRKKLSKYQSAGLVNKPINNFGINPMISTSNPMNTKPSGNCPPGMYFSTEKNTCVSVYPPLTKVDTYNPMGSFPEMEQEKIQFNPGMDNPDNTDQNYNSSGQFQENYDNSLLKYHQDNPSAASDKYQDWYKDKNNIKPKTDTDQNRKGRSIFPDLFGYANLALNGISQRVEQNRQDAYYKNNIANPYGGILGYNDNLSNDIKYGSVGFKSGGMFQSGGGFEEDEMDPVTELGLLDEEETKKTSSINDQDLEKLYSLGIPNRDDFENDDDYSTALDLFKDDYVSKTNQRKDEERNSLAMSVLNSPTINYSSEKNNPNNYGLAQPTNFRMGSSNSNFRTKSNNVNLTNLNPKLNDIFSTLSGNFSGLVVSSGNDSKHTKNSAHYDNDAIDIGANSSNAADYAKFRSSLPYLSKQLDFRYIDEGDHIHISTSSKGKLKEGGTFQEGGSTNRCPDGYYFDYIQGTCLKLQGNGKFNVDAYQVDSNRSRYLPRDSYMELGTDLTMDVLNHEEAHAEQNRNGLLSSYSSAPINKGIFDLTDYKDEEKYIFDTRENEINNISKNFKKSFQIAKPNTYYPEDFKFLSDGFKKFKADEFIYDIPGTLEYNASKMAEKVSSQEKPIKNTQINFRRKLGGLIKAEDCIECNKKFQDGGTTTFSIDPKRDMARRIVENANRRIREGNFAHVPESIKQTTHGRQFGTNSCIGGVCTVLKDEGAMNNINWSNTDFAAKAKENGFPNNGYGVKGISNLEPGDVLQHLNDPNLQGNYYPGHSQIFLGKDEHGYKFFDNYRGEGKDDEGYGAGAKYYSEEELTKLLDPNRKKNEVRANIYKVNPYTPPAQEISPEEKLIQQRDFGMSKGNAQYMRSDVGNVNSPLYSLSGQSYRDSVKDKLIDMMNNPELNNKLQKTMRLSAADLDRMKPLVYGMFGQESNFDSPESYSAAAKYGVENSSANVAASWLSNLASSVISPKRKDYVTSENELSMGPAQVKLKYVDEDVKKAFNIGTGSDLSDLEKSYAAALNSLNNAKKYTNNQIDKGKRPELANMDEYERALYWLNSPSKITGDKNTAENIAKNTASEESDQRLIIDKNGEYAFENLPSIEERKKWREANLLQNDKGSYPWKVLHQARNLQQFLNVDQEATLPGVNIVSKRGKRTFQTGGTTDPLAFLKNPRALDALMRAKGDNTNVRLSNNKILTTGLSPAEKQDLAAIADMNYRNKINEVARRKNAINKSNTDPTFKNSALGDKLRFFPEDPNSLFDEYINAPKMIGDMADNIGHSWAGNGTISEKAMSIAAPLLLGRSMGAGSINPISKNFWTNEISTKQFTNNLLNPLAGINFKKLTLSNQPLNNYVQQPKEVIELSKLIGSDIKSLDDAVNFGNNSFKKDLDIIRNINAGESYKYTPEQIKKAKYLENDPLKFDAFNRYSLPYLQNKNKNKIIFENMDITNPNFESNKGFGEQYYSIDNPAAKSHYMSDSHDYIKDPSFKTYEDAKNAMRTDGGNYFNSRYKQYKLNPLDQVLLPKNQRGGSISKMGYRDDSPYRGRKSININTPEGLIDMSNTGIPLWAEDETGYGKMLAPYSGMHQFRGKNVTETKMQDGGTTLNQSSKLTSQDYSNWNNLVKFAKTKNLDPNQLDHDSNIGFGVIDEYNKLNPNASFDRNKVKDIQQTMLDYRVASINRMKAIPITDQQNYKQFGEDYSRFMPGLSSADNFPGSKTLNWQVPTSYLTTNNNGTVNTQDTGFLRTTKFKKGGTSNNLINKNPRKLRGKINPYKK